MCTTCGCGTGETRLDGVALDTKDKKHDSSQVHVRAPAPLRYAPNATQRQGYKRSHTHAHTHAHTHSHAHDAGQTRLVRIEQDILAKNDAYAAQNRHWLAERGIHALNLVSSPGSGKTSLLVKTIGLLRGRIPIAVIEGDQQTSQDAERIRAAGAPAVQINTGKGCHLDAHMVGHALSKLDLPDDALLMIENVGNLVCPAAFDLGEFAKVVILSVTEGEDKPLKYPDMFHAARLMLLNKCDLLPYVDFDVDKAIEFARRVNPTIEVIQISATSGVGMEEWLRWIERGMRGSRKTDGALHTPSPPRPSP